MGLELALAIGFYFLPAVIAGHRRHYNYRAILALNLLTGWTLIGWVAALVWALTDPQSDKYVPTVVDRLGDKLRGPAYTPEERAALVQTEEARWAAYDDATWACRKHNRVVYCEKCKTYARKTATAA